MAIKPIRTFDQFSLVYEGLYDDESAAEPYGTQCQTAKPALAKPITYGSLASLYGSNWGVDYVCGCNCHCGFTTELFLGNITWAFDDGIDTYNITYTNFPLKSVLCDTLVWDVTPGGSAINKYLAFESYTSAAEGCEPELYILFGRPNPYTDEAPQAIKATVSGSTLHNVDNDDFSFNGAWDIDAPIGTFGTDEEDNVDLTTIPSREVKFQWDTQYTLGAGPQYALSGPTGPFVQSDTTGVTTGAA